MATVLKYRMYVDEVGNSDLESSDNPNHRFLSLTGVAVDLDYVKSSLHPEMESLKGDFFSGHHPDKPVIFHRKEMMNRRGSFVELRTELTREKFDRELLKCLRDWKYTVFSVCIDKKKHKETHTTWRYDPYHYCLKILLERFVLFLKRLGAVGDVMAESRGGKEDKRLKDSFKRIWIEGTENISCEIIQDHLTSKELKVKPKTNNISGLQLADLLAHPSRNEILAENGRLPRNLAPFGQKVVNIIQGKYDRLKDRVFGKKFI